MEIGDEPYLVFVRHLVVLIMWGGEEKKRLGVRAASHAPTMSIYDQLNGLPGEIYEQFARDSLDTDVECGDSGSTGAETAQVEIRKLQYEMRELRESTGKWITMLEVNMKELQSQIDSWKKEKAQMHKHLAEAIQQLQQENEVTTPSGRAGNI